MTSSPQSWARAERLDAARTVDALHAQTGVRLTLDGPCPGGQIGAAYVRWPDDHRSVLKWRPHSQAADMEAGPLAVTEALRLAGYPAPATELIAQVGHAVVLVQELLPGTTIDHLDHRSLGQALELNQLQADRLADRPDIPTVEFHLSEDGPGYCLHDPLRRHNRRSAALEHWITAVGADHPARMVGHDAVHMDFHPGNILASDGSITGVIDWDGAVRGDRRFDLVTLRFGIHAKEADPGVTQHLDAVLDGLPEDILRPVWAHMSLRMVDWSIRHFTPADVEHWLNLAEQRVS
ncbi:phosphotransferase [Streptomyces sp. NPDC050509]|uniref:phosphotransferase n=1 Tax=Streptomyces sp. NPDC050509 TaxID=3365620 RepID=UPI0037894F5B